MTAKTLSALCNFFGKKDITMDQLCDFLCKRCEELENRQRARPSSVNDEDFETISNISRHPVRRADIFTFRIKLCDNEVDKDFECVSFETLTDLATRFVGVSGIIDSQWIANTPRIYKTELVPSPQKFTSTGETVWTLYGDVFVDSGGLNAAIIDRVQASEKRKVSVGFSSAGVKCSICGEEIGKCSHRRGYQYEGNTCYGIIGFPTAVYEWAFVQ